MGSKTAAKDKEMSAAMDGNETLQFYSVSRRGQQQRLPDFSRANDGSS